MEPTNARVEGIDHYGQQYGKLAVWLDLFFKAPNPSVWFLFKNLKKDANVKKLKQIRKTAGLKSFQERNLSEHGNVGNRKV